MKRYTFYWKGNFYSVDACTIGGAMNQIRTLFSPKVALECWITEVTDLDTRDLVVGD